MRLESEHRYRFTDGPWPWISGLTYDGEHHAMPLFALDQAPAGVIDALLAQHDCLDPVPLDQARRLDPLRYRHEARRDDADFRRSLVVAGAEQRSAFDLLRKHYPERREIDGLSVRIDGDSAQLRQIVQALGAQLV